MNQMICPFCSDVARRDRLNIYITIFCSFAPDHELWYFFFSNDKKMWFDFNPDKAKEDRFSNALAIVPLPKLKALRNSKMDASLKIINVKRDNKANYIAI